MDTIEKYLKAMQQISAVVNVTVPFLETAEKVIELIRQAIDAEGASLFIVDQEKKELKFAIAKGEKEKQIMELQKDLVVKLGQGIVGRVAVTGKPEMINDVKKDTQFNIQVDRTIGFVTRNIICTPVTYRGRLVGALEIVNNHTGSFESYDLEFLIAVSGILSMVIENGRLYEYINEQNEFIENMLDNVSEAFIAVNTAGKIIIFNDSATQILGSNKSSALGKPCREALLRQRKLADIILLTTEKGIAIKGQKENIVGKNNREISIVYDLFPVNDNKGRHIGAGMKISLL